MTGTVSCAVRVDLIGMVRRTEAPTSAAGGFFTPTWKDTWKPSAPSVPGRPATEVTRPVASMPSVGSSTRTFAPVRTRPACSTRSWPSMTTSESVTVASARLGLLPTSAGSSVTSCGPEPTKTTSSEGSCTPGRANPPATSPASAGRARARICSVATTGWNPCRRYSLATASPVAASKEPSTAPGASPSRRRDRSSWATSRPDMPGPRSRNAGMRPSSRNTGRPETVASTSPAVSRAPWAGRLVTIRGPSLSDEGVTPSARGEPKCAVPRVTTRVDSTRSTTGTLISDGLGGRRPRGDLGRRADLGSGRPGGERGHRNRTHHQNHEVPTSHRPRHLSSGLRPLSAQPHDSS